MDLIISFFSTVGVILFWFILVLVPIIAFHELGHLTMSRIFGVKVPEYGIGMPLVKRTFYKRWRGMIFSFYWPLLGGFVRIYGDNDAIDEAFEISKEDPKKAEETYKQSRFQEIILNRELEFFLKDNNLDYDKKWKKFENSKFAKGLETETEKKSTQEYEQMYNQLLTLIQWEYEKEIHAKDTFFNKNWIQQSLIIGGGILFNLLAAILLFWLLFSVVSVPKSFQSIDDLNTIKEKAVVTVSSNNLIVGVSKDSPASKAGLKSGDQIINLAGVEARDINTVGQIRDIVNINKGKEIEIKYLAKEDNIEKTAKTVLEEKNGKTVLGVGPVYREAGFKAKDPVAGLQMSFDRTGFIFTESFKILGQIAVAPFPNQDKAVLDNVQGPIAVGFISNKIFQIAGFAGILEVMAAVSISLAVFNLLPIPALDGGRWVIITLNKILGKRNRKLEAGAISITFLLMILLAILIAFRDIQTVVSGRF